MAGTNNNYFTVLLQMCLKHGKRKQREVDGLQHYSYFAHVCKYTTGTHITKCLGSYGFSKPNYVCTLLTIDKTFEKEECFYSFDYIECGAEVVGMIFWEYETWYRELDGALLMKWESGDGEGSLKVGEVERYHIKKVYIWNMDFLPFCMYKRVGC